MESRSENCMYCEQIPELSDLKESLLLIINAGTKMPSLLEALECKYGSKGDVNPPIGDIPVAIFVPKRSPRLSVPTLLVLNDCDIDCAGDACALADKCADVVELDLANNKLSEWQEALQPRWDSLSYLVLNSTYVGWPNVHALLKALPALEELHLSLNEYSYVDLSGQNVNEKDQCEACSRLNIADLPEPVHESLKKLHFSGNPVCSWREISKLGYAFPNLETLLVNDCHIATLEPDPCEKCADNNGNKKSHDAFKRLRFLNLNNTGLATWDEVDRLAQFPALKSLRVQHERRLLLVARLPHISTLNGGGTVPAEEREAAERAFIRYYMEKPEYWELIGVHGKLDPLVSIDLRPEIRVQITFTCGDTSEVRTVDVYRYWELIGVHGKLDPLVSIDLRPEIRVQITFTCGDTSEVRTVDVYRYWELIRVHGKLDPLVSIDLRPEIRVQITFTCGDTTSKMRLFYVDQELRDSQGPEEMKYPTKQLYSYNMSSGDEIIIDSKLKHSVSNNSTA
ncbi:Tubulin-specific chaperone e [Operophtera brumata]|uniref:Tubulin-specific chaperone e n=1 Tax=Operophtera brumata TaxID=104452 RepID=A0A0L7LU89_OPEBR|nr:Tubulin-specific chaperone e [Operophtera brumata]